ncbi:MAG: HlyD family efflux transporter periplasmic adaptor subunit [Bacteroidales bacterium]|nr:HlyD family efflux transporter periplasmic adaptor subunit [Bacteroidales bacterium]
MFDREIFRKRPLEKMVTPDDLDELLQVNSVRTWLFFAMICVVLAGMLVWGFLGSIAQDVHGTGIIRLHELPREVVTHTAGQVDSVFCKTGDRISPGQRLLTINKLDEKTSFSITAPFAGEITGINVKEGNYVATGSPLLELIRQYNGKTLQPEVIFFVTGQEVSRLKPGMVATLQVEEEGIPPELLQATIVYIAAFPASKNAITKYIPEHSTILSKDHTGLYEVRADFYSDAKAFSRLDQSLIQTMNGSFCRVVVTVAKKSPIAYLMH